MAGRYLCQTTEVYRVNDEGGAAKLIEEAKRDSRFTVLKSSTEYKTIKSKGEIIDEYWKVSVTKQFTDIKDPDSTVTVDYDIDYGNFPTKEEENEDNDSED